MKLPQKLSDSLIYKIALGWALGSALFLIWTNLAVGIIGSEDNVANLMYFGVVLILITSAFIARFRPKGMAIALLATALAHASTIVIALIAGMEDYPGSSVYEIIMVNGFFITQFSLAGGLFWLASEESNRMDMETSA